MASPFQRYQSGIEASTGNLVQASGQMANQTFNALAGLGQSIGQGIQLYAENQRKSEAADATIASGIARFKSISDVWGQDPEFAPIVAQFAQRLEQYKDAPSQSYAKKAVMANEINMLGQDLAQTIQAQQVVRGRQIERVGGELLNQFKDVEKTSAPNFVKAGVAKFDTSKNYLSNEGEFMTGATEFKKAADAAGKPMKLDVAETLDAYRRDVLDSTNKAMSAGTLDPAIGSRILEQVEAQRSLEKQKAQSESRMPVLPSMAKSSRKDYEAVTGTAYQPEQDKTAVAAKKFAPDWLIKAAREEKIGLPSTKDISTLQYAQGVSSQVISSIQDRIKNGEKVTPNDIKAQLMDAETSVALPNFFTGVAPSSMAAGYTRYSEKATTFKTPNPATEAVMKAVEKTGVSGDKPLSASNVLDVSRDIAASMQKFNEKAAILSQKAVKAQEEVQPDMSKAPVVSLGKIPVGSIEYERKVAVAEKKAKIADLMTQRIGIVDPVTGKKTLPVGFDSWFKQMVPESDARVVDVDGIKLLWDGKKFEQVKQEKPMTMKEIRENQIGVYGQQTPDGGLVPEEFIPNSGVYLSGIFKGSDSADAAFRDEQEKLIDARRSVKVLQGINDKFGEAVNLKDKGIATVELMNLKAALRRDIVGVGQVSNYEQKLIEDVIADPTAFLSFESKDRAILLALAERVDRKIVSNATKFGLQVTMKGQEGESRYASLRQKYLAEKSK